MTSGDLVSAAVDQARAGQLDEAESSLRRAIDASPSVAAYRVNLGALLAQRGKIDDAIPVLRRAVELEPGLFDGQANLGNALAASGKFDEAIIAFRVALRIRTGAAGVQRALAVSLQMLGDGPGAVEAYRHYLQLEPADGGSWFELARLLRAAGDINGAIEALRKCVESQPNRAEAYGNLGSLLLEARRFEEAVNAYRHAAALFPQSPEVHHDLGVALHKLHRWEEAIAVYRQALALKTDYPEAHVSLGAALYRLGEIEQAKDAYRKALSQRPGYAYARKNLGAALLLQGDFANGWAAFEARYEIEPVDLAKTTLQPMWHGEALNGRRILLVLEQGLGDVIQFIRYAPMVQQRGGRVSAICWQGLKRLFTGQLGIEQVVGENEPTPAYDVYCRVGALPKIFATSLKTIASHTPYLHADPLSVAQWNERINLKERFSVGVVWAGNPSHLNDSLRSILLTDLAPFSEIPGVGFYSLQRGPRANDIGQAPFKLINLSPYINDMADTAAAIANLDLVITVDTSVAHLAGALGKPVWVLLQFVPDWRWLLERSDSPWYPTMKLFRQPKYGDWQTPIGEAAAALKALVQ